MSQDLDLRMLAYSVHDKRMMLTMAPIVKREYFLSDYQAMWYLISGCFLKYKEIPTERVLREVAGEGWEGGLKEIWNNMKKLSINTSEYPMDLEFLKKRHNGQLLRAISDSISSGDSEELDLNKANVILRDTVCEISKLYQKEAFKEGSLSDTSTESLNEYEEIERNPILAEGIHTGFTEFDRISNGLRASELMLIGGRSGTGKSALAMNIAVNAWLGANKVPEDMGVIDPGSFKRGRSIAYFTIEMPYEALKRRLHACIAGVRLYGLRDGSLDAKEKARYFAALKFMEKYPYQFEVIDIPRGASVQYVESKYEELCQKHIDYPPELVVVDYITLMGSGGGNEQQDWLNLGHISEQFHEFCRVHAIPSISPVQLNRPPKGNHTESRPEEERIARSSMLFDNANIAVAIEKRKDEHLATDMIVHIIKMRDGDQGVFTLQKRLDIMRLSDNSVDWSPDSYDGG
jgi:replicative DNA helicase